MSSRELTEWVLFYSLEPFGNQIDMLGHAITSSTVANVNRQKGRKAYKPEDFMPKFEKQTKSVDEMIQFAQMMTIGMGGKDERYEDE